MSRNRLSVGIIGAGPAGIICAIECGKSGADVTLYEKNSEIGAKLIVAGGGMCNYSHTAPASESIKRYGNKGMFLKHAFKIFSPQKTMTYFKALGIDTFIRSDGKVFPVSKSGKKFVDKLKIALLQNGVKIVLNRPVIRLIRQRRWCVVTLSKTIAHDVIVIATGGMSYSHLGTTGDAYRWFKALKLDIVSPRPALTSLSLNCNHQMVSGISLKGIKISVKRFHKTVIQDIGEVLFTHKGLSGPLILNLSRYIEKNDTIYVNWCQMDRAVFDQYLLDAVAENGKRQLKTSLEDLPLPKGFILFQLKKTNVKPDKKLAELTRKERLQIVEIFCDEKLSHPQCLGFKTAMVTAGGLSLKAISSKSFEVITKPNLYAIGEVIDIDGDTGGYNIQAALSMGYVAAQHIVER